MINPTLQLRDADAPVKLALADRIRQFAQPEPKTLSFLTTMTTYIRGGSRRHTVVAPARRLQLMDMARDTLMGVSEDLNSIQMSVSAKR